MMHRPEWISEEWMHEFTLEQFKPPSTASEFKTVSKVKRVLPLILKISLCVICCIKCV